MQKSKQTKSLKRFLTMASFLLITAASSQVYAQNGVGINSTGAAADPSAALDVASTNKGVLVPRMRAAEKVAIVSPANGLLIFQIDGVTGFWYYNATTSSWIQAVGPQGPAGPTGATGQGGVTNAGSDIAIAGTGTVADPYVVSSKIYTIGLWPELGGYVFRISADGRHGLVAETQDQPATYSWFSAQEGISNPLNHSTNGRRFMDWRLPTTYELNEMNPQKVAIGGFNYNYYWSSTEYNATDAYYFTFYYGAASHDNKGNQNYVRAIRAF